LVIINIVLCVAKTEPKCNKNAIATQTKKETTVVVCLTTVPDISPLGKSVIVMPM
jgi:hypothetical protein